MDDLENFSFLIPGELAGMGFPHSSGALDGLRALGFRSLVSLSRRAPDHHAVGALLHLHCPMADFARIPPLDLHRVALFLERAPRLIAVHGEGGVGRTGVVLACRLVSLGSTAQEAVTAVRRVRPGSIDDPELEASVADYERFARAAPVRAAPFNFATASPLDRIVHGAERPGFAGDDPPEAAIEAWLGFMSRQGIREVVCLLAPARMAAYGTPLLDRYRREFLRVTHVPMDGAIPSPAALAEALEALRRAEAGGAPAVVHGDAGIGRAGLVLAAWLRARHGVRADLSIELTRGHAGHFGAVRDPLAAGDQALALLAAVRPLSEG